MALEQADYVEGRKTCPERAAKGGERPQTERVAGEPPIYSVLSLTLVSRMRCSAKLLP
jgi:hypothetical protein